MAELIASISFTEFKKLKAEQLRRLKSYEITFNGEYWFTFVNGNIGESGYLRTQVEYLAQTTNAVGGESLEEVMELVGV